MDVLALSESERAFLNALDRLGVRYLVVGMSAALLQGARGLTEDIDLWFERLDDPRIGEAANSVGGVWVIGTFDLRPPTLGGEALGDRFDVVTHAHGLASFASEYSEAITVPVDGLKIPVLPLERVIASKRAAGRLKDKAVLPLLEAALTVLREEQEQGE
jgi:predicted nucleotidyltransferase